MTTEKFFSSTAMESETISKNGASPKSQMSKGKCKNKGI
jgi:hypothetical protein